MYEDDGKLFVGSSGHRLPPSIRRLGYRVEERGYDSAFLAFLCGGGVLEQQFGWIVCGRIRKNIAPFYFVYAECRLPIDFWRECAKESLRGQPLHESGEPVAGCSDECVFRLEIDSHGHRA